eukprot:295490-Chlamydomonas_euryale.AAC.1
MGLAWGLHGACMGLAWAHAVWWEFQDFHSMGLARGLHERAHAFWWDFKVPWTAQALSINTTAWVSLIHTLQQQQQQHNFIQQNSNPVAGECCWVVRRPAQWSYF